MRSRGPRKSPCLHPKSRLRLQRQLAAGSSKATRRSRPSRASCAKGRSLPLMRKRPCTRSTRSIRRKPPSYQTRTFSDATHSMPPWRPTCSTLRQGSIRFPHSRKRILTRLCPKRAMTRKLQVWSRRSSRRSCPFSSRSSTSTVQPRCTAKSIYRLSACLR